MTEKELQNKCIRYAKKLGIFYWKFQDKFNAGFPDLMLAKGGKVVFVELKRPGKKPTPLQAAVHNEMKQAGLDVRVVDNFEDFKEVTQWMN